MTNVCDLIKKRDELRQKYGDRYESNTEYCEKRWDVDEIKKFIEDQIVPDDLDEQALVFDLQIGDFSIEIFLNDQLNTGDGLTLDYEIRKINNGNLTDDDAMGSFNIDVPDVELEMLRLLEEYLQTNNLDYGEVKN